MSMKNARAADGRFIVWYMKKLLFGALILGSFACAETMPAGSPQHEVTERLAGDLLGAFTLTPCPPELEIPNIQTACGVWEGGSANFTRVLDAGLEMYNDDVTSSGARELALTPQTPGWLFDANFGRYEKTYALNGGEYRVVFAPVNTFIGEAVIFYSDDRLPTETL
jgi:hypothetical protein